MTDVTEVTRQPAKNHLMHMSFVLVFFIAFSLLAFVVGPALRIEDRPAFKRPDEKVRWLF